jgi:hypothetical protein
MRVEAQSRAQLGSTFLPPLHKVLVYVTLSGMAPALALCSQHCSRSLHVLYIKIRALTSNAMILEVAA